jgi:DHA2 family multidrug resistance protein
MRPVDQQASVSLGTWLGFSLMGLGMFMAILDIQVVATSLPTIQRALRVGPDQMSWVQTAYLIAEVIAIPLTGFLTRLLTLRWLFVMAVSLFTVASIGCASSDSFATLIGFRVVQGFSGGTLIPAVFSAVFLLFPLRRQSVATTIAGVLAVLAPTVGPIGGGWITQSFSWHWLFLINVLPGLIAALGAVALLPRDQIDLKVARVLDPLALGLMAIALSALEIGLKEAPGRGWASPLVIGLMVLSLVSAVVFVRRSLKGDRPVVDLTTLRDRNFAIGCGLSFVVGIGLFGSVYMMPVFLALVRGHDALQIGEIMLITGAAQLVTAPIAVALERRVDARILTGVGFLLFSVGLGLSAFQTEQTDFAQMLWPQMLRGSAIMFCLLPPTRLALGRLEAPRVADASGLFNLMRNLGGAIGLALIDTVIYGRAPVHARAIIAQLKAGNVETAGQIGIPVAIFRAHAHAPLDARTAAMLQPMVQKLSLVQAINDAWALVAILTLCALATVPFARPQPPEAEDDRALLLGLIE